MKSLAQLSDDEIDKLLLFLFQDASLSVNLTGQSTMAEKSDEDLRRIRSRNHPDKWPNVDIEIYRIAVEELDRRRKKL